MAFFDIYLLEALINGVLLGGVFALLSLGLNLIFGVIDVVWICYAELIMLGMYGMYFVYSVYHAPFAVAAVTCIAGVAVLGVILHVLVIAPLLGAAPINQLLATGGVLFFLQSAATVMFGIEFKNLGLRLPVLKAAGMFISYSRLLAFAAALVGMVLVYLFLSRTYTGAAIRAIAQDREIVGLMGIDQRRVYLVVSAIGGALAGLAGALYAHYSSYIVPEIYVPLLTIYIFLALTAGGIGNNWGAVIGAFVVVFFLESTRFLIGIVPWLSAEQLAALREFLVGLGLLLVLFLRPRGLMPEPLPRLANARE